PVLRAGRGVRGRGGGGLRAAAPARQEDHRLAHLGPEGDVPRRESRRPRRPRHSSPPARQGRDRRTPPVALPPAPIAKWITDRDGAETPVSRPPRRDGSAPAAGGPSGGRKGRGAG